MEHVSKLGWYCWPHTEVKIHPTVRKKTKLFAASLVICSIVVLVLVIAEKYVAPGGRMSLFGGRISRGFDIFQWLENCSTGR